MNTKEHKIHILDRYVVQDYQDPDKTKVYAIDELGALVAILVVESDLNERFVVGTEDLLNGEIGRGGVVRISGTFPEMVNVAGDSDDPVLHYKSLISVLRDNVLSKVWRI